MIVFQEFRSFEENDFVTLFDGETSRAAVLKQLSGSVTSYATYCSKQRHMHITFSPTLAFGIPRSGFIATFKTRTYNNQFQLVVHSMLLLDLIIQGYDAHSFHGALLYQGCFFLMIPLLFDLRKGLIYIQTACIIRFTVILY